MDETVELRGSCSRLLRLFLGKGGEKETVGAGRRKHWRACHGIRTWKGRRLVDLREGIQVFRKEGSWSLRSRVVDWVCKAVHGKDMGGGEAEMDLWLWDLGGSRQMKRMSMDRFETMVFALCGRREERDVLQVLNIMEQERIT